MKYSTLFLILWMTLVALVGWQIGGYLIEYKKHRCEQLVRQFQQLYPQSVIVCFP